MNRVIISLVLLSFQFPVLTQIKGVVVDDSDTPIEFVNVSLHRFPDSVLISGAVTDRYGAFTIESNTTENVFLRVSMLGYESVTLTNIGKSDSDTIVLSESSQWLSDVLVKANRPLHKMESDGLATIIENSVLSHLGTANDVLAQLPFIKGDNGKYTVFGRGTPLIYLNNRPLRDNDELKQLKSSEIKEVKIILNPGAQYDASIGSVIRITTIKPVGEGLSGSLYTFVRQRRHFDHYEYLDLNYRKDKLDLFGKISYDKTAYEQNQKNETILNLDNKYITGDNKKMKAGFHSWAATIGANYAFLPTHLIGLRYVYSRSPRDNWNFSGKTLHFINEENDNNYTSTNLTDRKNHRHYLNTYYHNELKNKTTIHFEGDFIRGGSAAEQSSDYKNLGNNEAIFVKSNSETDYSLYAGKLVIEKPLTAGRINFGSESSYTGNNQSYEMLNKNISEDLPSNKDKSKQFLIAAFITVDYTWNNFSLNAGLRYEHIDFKYYYNNELSKIQSRIYNNWFPSLTFSYKTDYINMALGYKTIVRRPNYYNLRSSITYNSPYDYEGGNPSLKPMFANKLSHTFGWKDLQMEVSYNWFEDNLLFIAEQFKDKPVTLFTMINLPYSERLDVYVNYSPTIKFWKPTFAVGFYKQNLYFKNQTYNKPHYSYMWNNIIQLPKDFQLALNMRGNLRGNLDISIYKPAFRTDIKLSKRFYDNKLSVVLNATDIFATDLERWSMNTDVVDYNKWNDGDRRGFSLQLTYRFNPSKTKYKGQGASGEINRL